MTLVEQSDICEATAKRVADISSALTCEQAALFAAIKQLDAPAVVAASQRVRGHVREMGLAFADYHATLEQIEATLKILCPK